MSETNDDKWITGFEVTEGGYASDKRAVKVKMYINGQTTETYTIRHMFITPDDAAELAGELMRVAGYCDAIQDLIAASTPIPPPIDYGSDSE